MENFKYLMELCELKSFSSRNSQKNPISLRVQYIIDTIKEIGLEPIVSIFGINGDVYEEDDNKYVNVEIHFNIGADKSLIFIAHHDISNPNSENCQDNTASCANLLYLAKLLKNINLDKNIFIVFTDAEEIVSTKYSGAAHLARKINNNKFKDVIGVVNLELTANGNNYYVAGDDNDFLNKILSLDNTHEVRTPFSDTYTMKVHEITSICTGSLSNNEIEDVNDSNYCSTWGLCHSSNDTFERSAREEDMANFVEVYLMSIVNLEF